MLTPDQVASKWQRNISQATQSITDGVNAVTESPMAKAAQRVDAQVAGVQRAASSGKTARALNAVPLASWKTALIQKGIPRIGPGATAAQPKMAQFMGKLLPFQSNLKQQLNASMPRGDVNANRARMNAWMDGMSQFQKNS